MSTLPITTPFTVADFRQQILNYINQPLNIFQYSKPLDNLVRKQTVEHSLQELEKLSLEIGPLDILSSISALNSNNMDDIAYLCVDEKFNSSTFSGKCISILPVSCRSGLGSNLPSSVQPFKKTVDKKLLFFGILRNYAYIVESLNSIHDYIQTDDQRITFNNIINNLNTHLTSKMNDIRQKLEYFRDATLTEGHSSHGIDACNNADRDLFNKIYNKMISMNSTMFL
jgi:hypothetical protein